MPTPPELAARAKPLNRMDRLGDMLHFPVAVNAGATANVLLTIVATWWVAPRWPLAPALFPAVWLLLVLAANLLPVVLLRRTLTPTTDYPALGAMHFFRDQHKFSDWVYLAASANMAVWVLAAAALAGLHRTGGTLLALEAVALIATFAPVPLRALRRE